MYLLELGESKGRSCGGGRQSVGHDDEETLAERRSMEETHSRRNGGETERSYSGRDTESPLQSKRLVGWQMEMPTVGLREASCARIGRGGLISLSCGSCGEGGSCDRRRQSRSAGGREGVENRLTIKEMGSRVPDTMGARRCSYRSR